MGGDESKLVKRGWQVKNVKKVGEQKGESQGYEERANRDEKSIAWVLQEQRSDPLCYSISHPGSGIQDVRLELS